jgi:hypothetical protein
VHLVGSVATSLFSSASALLESVAHPIDSWGNSQPALHLARWPRAYCSRSRPSLLHDRSREVPPPTYRSVVHPTYISTSHCRHDALLPLLFCSIILLLASSSIKVRLVRHARVAATFSGAGPAASAWLMVESAAVAAANADPAVAAVWAIWKPSPWDRWSPLFEMTSGAGIAVGDAPQVPMSSSRTRLAPTMLSFVMSCCHTLSNGPRCSLLKCPRVASGTASVADTANSLQKHFVPHKMLCCIA